MRFVLAAFAAIGLSICAYLAVQVASRTVVPPVPSAAAIDAEVARAMAATGAKGLAVAVVENGRIVHVKSYGMRNAAGDPLQTNTIMYGASLTKAVFAYTVMQLVDEGVLKLDTPIERYLSKPLPAYTEPEVEDRYARWSDLAGDERWRKLTPRILLTHSPGFANFARSNRMTSGAAFAPRARWTRRSKTSRGSRPRLRAARVCRRRHAPRSSARSCRSQRARSFRHFSRSCRWPSAARTSPQASA